ncbi:hypothetical protein TrispH2_011560 [Trichoplax sp. H2]|nr:hypothetical protein TrispH2_011560 [Trichoplax sp. H2]|eukprot:RDD36330.1 hypothetical protein TrispH2_011560 [Trichoplax sp. H2]
MRTILVFTLLVVAVNCRAISKNTDEKSKTTKMETEPKPKLMIGYPLFKKEDLDSQGYALFRKDDSQGYPLFRKDDSQGYPLFRKDDSQGYPLFRKDVS